MTLNAGDIKRLNRQHIIGLLVAYGRTTKTELAQRSGLSIPTVFNIVSSMEKRGVIEYVEDAVQVSTPGRPRQYLRLNGDSRYAFGVRYEGELLCVGLTNLCGSMRAVRVRRGKLSIEELFCTVLPACMEEMLQSARVDRQSLAGVGIGLAGGLRPSQEQVRMLEERTGLHVLVGEDTHFAAAGEYVSRKQRTKNMLYVSVGTKVACGVMIEGLVRTGRAGQLGRIGSMILEDGKTLDSLIGREALRRRFGIPPVYDRAAASAHTVKYISLALHNLLLGCDTIDTIVLGGDVIARLGDDVADAVRRELAKLNDVPVCVYRQSCPLPSVFGAAFSIFYVTLEEITGMDE